MTESLTWLGFVMLGTSTLDDSIPFVACCILFQVANTSIKSQTSVYLGWSLAFDSQCMWVSNLLPCWTPRGWQVSHSEVNPSPLISFVFFLSLRCHHIYPPRSHKISTIWSLKVSGCLVIDSLLCIVVDIYNIHFPKFYDGVGGGNIISILV